MMAHTSKIPCDFRVTLLYPPCMACICDISKATRWTALENGKAGAALEGKFVINILSDCGAR